MLIGCPTDIKNHEMLRANQIPLTHLPPAPGPEGAGLIQQPGAIAMADETVTDFAGRITGLAAAEAPAEPWVPLTDMLKGA